MDNFVCRGCASNNAYIALFEDINKSTLEKFSECANIKAEKADGLPEYLCGKCFNSLEIVYKFIMQCKTADRYFREQILDEKQNSSNENDMNIKIEALEEITSSWEIDSNCSEEMVSNDGEFENFEVVDHCNDTSNTIDHTVSLKLPTIAKIFDPKSECLDEVNMLKCRICATSFDNIEELIGHKECAGKCNKWVIKKRYYNAYINTNGRPEYYKCDICQHRYLYLRTLSRHFSVYHKEDIPFNCIVCGDRFSDAKEYEDHKKQHTERKYVCDICGKNVSTAITLKIHKKAHLSIKKKRGNKIQEIYRPHTCEHCGEVSTTKLKHIKHMKVHLKRTLFECRFCKKEFKYESMLNQHKMVHTGEKIFQCDMCSQMFRQYQQLKSHKLIHTGLRPHKCQYCSKTFALKGNLTCHERLHTGDKPYKCSLCDESFRTIYFLKRHKHNVH